MKSALRQFHWFPNDPITRLWECQIPMCTSNGFFPVRVTLRGIGLAAAHIQRKPFAKARRPTVLTDGVEGLIINGQRNGFAISPAASATRINAHRLWFLTAYGRRRDPSRRPAPPRRRPSGSGVLHRYGHRAVLVGGVGIDKLRIAQPVTERIQRFALRNSGRCGSSWRNPQTSGRSSALL